MVERPLEQRVAVTGLGVVSPLGVGLDATWRAAVEATSCAGPITLYDPSETTTTIACEVSDFDPADFMPSRIARRMERFAQFGVAAARMAFEDSGLSLDGDARDRAGSIVGSGIGGLRSFEVQAEIMAEKGPERLSPLFIPLMIANMGAAQISMQLGLRGPLSCVCTACASGNHAIGDAAEAIRRGDADVMFAGGAEATITQIGIGAFNAMRALSTRNDDPTAASRPFDVGRDGFVMGEGAGILVLERMDLALARDADVYGEIVGYGATGDAHHLTEPDPTGAAPARAMRMALGHAGLEPAEVDYVNAHATATPVGDTSELAVLRMALGDAAPGIAVSSTKSMHGHCLGAAGGIEGVLTVKAMSEGIIPPTINLDDLDPTCEGVDHVANAARPADIRVAVSNGFGFGGHNAVIAMRRVEDASL